MQEKRNAYSELLSNSKFIDVQSIDQINVVQLKRAPNVFAAQIYVPQNTKINFVLNAGIEGDERPLVAATLELSGSQDRPTLLDQKTVVVCLHKTFSQYRVICESSDGSRVEKFVNDQNLVTYLDELTNTDTFNLTQSTYKNKTLLAPSDSELMLFYAKDMTKNYLKIQLQPHRNK